jgi:hypothetical protein
MFETILSVLVFVFFDDLNLTIETIDSTLLTSLTL